MKRTDFELIKAVLTEAEVNPEILTDSTGTEALSVVYVGQEGRRRRSIWEFDHEGTYLGHQKVEIPKVQ